MRLGISISILLFISALAYAQEPALDSSMLKIDQPAIKLKVKKEIIPKRAALYSLIFPGAGQIYNGKIWKAPIVYGALGTTIYLIDYNRDFYTSLQDAYVIRLAGVEDDEYTGIISSADGIKSARDSFRKNMELAYFGTAAIYLLQIIEAYVDAHLQGFDVNDDLSLHFFPQVQDLSDPAPIKIGLFLSL